MKTLQITFLLIFTLYSNSGKSQQWAFQNSGTIQNLYSVYFYDLSNGWAVGNSGTIIHTTNGGLTWSAQVSGTTSNLKSVFFVSTTDGWVVGLDGVILHTTNGGSSWTISYGPPYAVLKSVFFINPNKGWIGGSNAGAPYITSTIDGGQNWMTQVETTGSTLVNDIFFIDDNHGWAVGLSGNADGLYTTTGGFYWFEFSYGIACPAFNDVYFLDTQTGIMVGGNNCMLYDGGTSQTFIDVDDGTSQTMRGVHLFDYSHGIAVGDSGVITVSTDYTTSLWHQISSPTTNDLLSLCVKDNNNAWICGDNGTIIKGTNLLTTINEGITQSYSVYPNPFTDKTTFRFDNKIITIGSLEITDLTGRILKRIDNITGSSVEINNKGLVNGMYLLNVFNNDQKIGSVKIICK